MKFKRRKFEDDEPIPTASMADITFLLIIFFIVSTVMAVDRGLMIDLPQSEVAQKISLREITISISKEGKLLADGEALTVAQLGKYVKEKLAVNPSRKVIVKSDRNVYYGKIVDVMDELLKAGVKDVSLPTIAEKGEEGR